MANVLKREKQVQAVAGLTEGMSIRAIERTTGIHRDTIMRLGVRVGNGCHTILDELMRDIRCDYLQIDEIWGYVGKKQKHVGPREKNVGDAWTFVAIDAASKAVPAFKVGNRDRATTHAFIHDVADRIKNRVQISTDAMTMYVDAIESAFGSNVDYGQIVKTFTSEKPLPSNVRYSPPNMKKVSKHVVAGDPEPSQISTSYVEKQNHTMRMHCRRLTRLTNAFSKKLENFQAAVALHFGYYNLVKIHRTVKVTPATAVGVTSGFWTLEELVDRALEAGK